jgi:putative N-acetyltransferase (TIGR04045 family)
VLDRVLPWGHAVRPYVCPHVTAEIASEAWQLAAYFALRRRIFVHEQRLFTVSDADEHDETATPIVALSQLAGMADEVVGVVRIYESAPGTWFGGRLGVAASYRARGAVGAALITAAVSTAHAWGCRRFLATVQEANVRYFERHHFRALEATTVCGRPHRLMEAELDCYPACSRASRNPAEQAA